VNLQALILIGVAGIVVQGCSHLGGMSADSIGKYATPQALIDQKQLNAADGSGKEYVYDWGNEQNSSEPQALYPRKYLGNYCHAKGGKFALLYKSNMSLVKEQAQKKRLNAHSNVKQGVGAYQCVLSDARWIVSIEPTAESKLDSNAKARVVRLQTRILSLEEAKQLYRNAGSNVSEKKSNKTTTAKTNKLEVKETENKKDSEKKKDSKAEPVVASVVETPQQQQLKAYVAARRDLSKGKNQLNACNNAQRAYNYGKLTGTNANVYTDSGMLVARCLTSVPAYRSRFSNPKGQANKILQNLASNYNHAGAKRMLAQGK
jgi:hypothetical protein